MVTKKKGSTKPPKFKPEPAKTVEIEDKRNVYQRIHAVMEKVTYLKKDGVVTIRPKGGGNPFTYNAITHDAVTAAIREAMLDNGLISVPSIKEIHTEGERTFVQIAVNIINSTNKDWQADQDFITIIGAAHADDRGDKATGKAISMAVKYVYLKVFMLETGEDEESRSTQKETKPISASQYKVLTFRMGKTHTNLDDFVKFINTQKGTEITDLDALPEELYEYAFKALEKKAKQGKKDNE